MILLQELESELLRLRSCLNNSYNIAKKMSEDETADISERLEACQPPMISDSLVQILREYPEFKRQIHPQMQTQSDEMSEQESTIRPTTFKRVHS